MATRGGTGPPSMRWLAFFDRFHRLSHDVTRSEPSTVPKRKLRAQIKVCGEREHLRSIRDRLSETIHDTAQNVLGLPSDKRFHRFVGLDREDFLYPSDRSQAYTIIEISLFEGRNDETKRALLEGLMTRISDDLGLAPDDIEITLFETPRSHWGIRGRTGDQLVLTYNVERCPG